MKKFLTFLLFISFVLVLVGCDDSGSKDVKPSSVEITGAVEQLEVGKSVNLTATVSPADASDKTVKWSIDDPSIASVASGKVTGLKVGTVKVTAAANADANVKKTVTIKVVEASASSSLTIVGKKSTIMVDETVNLTAQLNPANASAVVTWESSDASVVSVANGTIKGLKAGSATITATYGTAKDSFVVTVVSSTGSVTIEGTDLEVEAGSTLNLTYNANGAKLVWASSNEEVATVADGVVTAVKAGTVTITATIEGTEIKAEVVVIVNKKFIEGAPDFIQIVNYKKSMKISGGPVALAAYAYSNTQEVTNSEVTWSVDKPEIATISEDGVVTPVAVGSFKVTATSKADETVYSTIALAVVDESKEVIYDFDLTVTMDKLEFLLHESLATPRTVAFVPNTADNRDLFWESSNTDVVKIYTSAKTPYIVGVGEATITCYSAYDTTKVFEFNIKVIDYVNPTSFTVVDNFDVELTEATIEEGRTKTAVVKVEPFNGNPKAEFTSSDEAVAKVDENGVITAVKAGTATITVKSAVEGVDFSKSIAVTVKEKEVEKTDPESITVTVEREMVLGYKIKATAAVYPTTASQNIIWEVFRSDVDKVSISEDGYITALQVGSVKIRAVSAVDSKVKSSYIAINIKEPPQPFEVGDMKGYEIIIMNADSALTDNDPFLPLYKKADKTYKQRAWNEVQSKYNCKIKVVAYPDVAPWGQQRINWIIENATNGTSACDLGIISSNWIPQFAAGNAAVDVTDMYNKYGLSQMEPAAKTAGSFKGKLYVASTGISSTETFVDLGLFYNYGMLTRLGLESPAKMFNEGKWTYTNFKAWILDAQAKLGENQFALQGSPYYFWFGMTNAAGVQVLDADMATAKIDSNRSQAASTLIYELVSAGAVNATQTWAESDDLENSFHDGDTLMTTGYLWFVRNSGRWPSTLWGEGSQFGYVPFPYPDDLPKEDTRISVSGLSMYMYIAGRQYPEALGKDGHQKVWYVMNEMFLNTIKYQEEDELFDPETVITNSLKERIDDPESITAIMFYNARRVFFDPAHGIYGSTSATPLKTPANNVMYAGKDYAEEFNSVAEQYDTDVKKYYAS